MNTEELIDAVTGLLYDLHALNKLDIRVINSISHNFRIDAVELCELEGITYNVD